MISSHSVASNCSVPLVFLRSREISLMVKSVWKGAICSRRIKRCFIKKSCPSTWVQSITRKNICITCEEQPLSEKNNFNTFTCVSYLPVTRTNNPTNNIFPLVCSAINYIPASTSSTYLRLTYSALQKQTLFTFVGRQGLQSYITKCPRQAQASIFLKDTKLFFIKDRNYFM